MILCFIVLLYFLKLYSILLCESIFLLYDILLYFLIFIILCCLLYYIICCFYLNIIYILSCTLYIYIAYYIQQYHDKGHLTNPWANFFVIAQESLPRIRRFLDFYCAVLAQVEEERRGNGSKDFESF